MKPLLAAGGVLGILVLAACSDEVKTREWYVDHPKELAVVSTD
ncbi:EexN family lipoprotein, partial [Pseudomonas syringae]